MARGMDIDNVLYVLSYEAPQYLKTHIHRIGRTARAGKAGTAVTLLEKKEVSGKTEKWKYCTNLYPSWSELLKLLIGLDLASV